MSRLSGFGLAAVAFVMTMVAATSSLAAAAAAPAAIDAASIAAGMKAAPPLVKLANIPCTITNARLVGTGMGADKINATFYEVACQEGLGYIIVKKDKVDQPQAYDCLMMAVPGPDGKKGTLQCALPANLIPATNMQKVVALTGRPCTVINARYVGSTKDQTLYEVACQGGSGLVIEAPSAIGGPAITANNCLAYTSGAVKCTLTTSDQELAVAEPLAVSSGKCAAVKAKRYVLGTPDEQDYFEVACADGSGYMLHVDKAGKLAETIPCAAAFELGGGCTLTDARQAQTQQNAVYSDLAKKAGFNCTVSKYALFPTSDSTKDIVEMACSNRPDGAVGIFPAHGASEVYNCLRSEDEGYKCTYTPIEALFPDLTQQLKAKGKGSCAVSAARPFARGDDGSDFIEVACADGGPGWVIAYAKGSSAPTQLLNCVEAANLSGGCQLPTNKKKS